MDPNDQGSQNPTADDGQGMPPAGDQGQVPGTPVPDTGPAQEEGEIAPPPPAGEEPQSDKAPADDSGTQVA